jgi:pantoate--beta-alanine ligase
MPYNLSFIFLLPKMQTIQNIKEMQSLADLLRSEGKTIGLVPTMGFMHEGHLSLMRIARPKCDVLVVSIFVNPTQFGPNEDLNKYPRDFDRDEKLCREEKVDVIFYPTKDMMYSEPYVTFINVEKLSETMCGLSRPGHFKGVATVVAKLFNIVKPHFAVFGQKDFQQAVIIKQMVRDLNFPVEILTGPIVREVDGLAMSSRNRYLSPTERQNALVLYNSLKLAEKLVREGNDDSDFIHAKMKNLIQQIPEANIDYIAIVDSNALIPVGKIKNNALIALAVKIGSTRLIDNTLIRI